MIKNYLKQVKVGPGVVRAGPLFMKASAWFTRRAGSAVAAGEKQEWHGFDDRKAWLVSPRCRRPPIEESQREVSGKSPIARQKDI